MVSFWFCCAFAEVRIKKGQDQLVFKGWTLLLFEMDIKSDFLDLDVFPGYWICSLTVQSCDFLEPPEIEYRMDLR